MINLVDKATGPTCCAQKRPVVVFPSRLVRGQSPLPTIQMNFEPDTEPLIRDLASCFPRRVTHRNVFNVTCTCPAVALYKMRAKKLK